MKNFNTIVKASIVGSLLIAGFNLSAQQVSLFNHNITNPFTINPAKAGQESNQLFFQHRNELIGVDGAPEFSLLSAEFRLDKSRSAIGFQFSHETANIINNTAAFVTYASHFKLNDKSNFSFGISAGVRHNAIAFDRVNVTDNSDNLLFAFNQSSTNFDANFGINYQFQKLDVQLSGLQLFANEANYVNTFEEKELNYKFVRHFVASAGYQFFEDRKIQIKPIIQVRGAEGLPFLPEAILRFDYENLLWLAGHYRNDASWAATFGLNINDRYTVGYSAEFATSDISAQNSGTHEIIFGIKLNKQSRDGASSKTLRKLKDSNRSYEERLDFLNQQNKEQEEELEKQRKRLKELEKNGNSMNFDELKRMIDEANSNAKSETEKAVIKKEVETKAQSIQFQTASNQLKTTSFSALDEIVSILKENPTAKVEIDGHTDNMGEHNNNMKLSQKRAEVVKEYFTQKGISADRIIAVGFGETKPIAPNDTPAGMTKNRRVEVKVEL